MTRLALFVIVAFTLCQCNQKSKSDNSQSDSSDINFQQIESNSIIQPFKVIDGFTDSVIRIDTLPPFISDLRVESRRQIDTTKILLNSARKALGFGRYLLDSLFGADKMKRFGSFKIGLIDKKYWIVTGVKDKNSLGGWPEIILSKYDGKIIYWAVSK